MAAQPRIRLRSSEIVGKRQSRCPPRLRLLQNAFASSQVILPPIGVTGHSKPDRGSCQTLLDGEGVIVGTDIGAGVSFAIGADDGFGMGVGVVINVLSLLPQETSSPT